MIEGVSYLLLLGVAMPLKHLADMPDAVRVVGWVHGVLFIVLCAALLIAKATTRMSWSLAGMVFVASLLPFGPFVIDGRLRRARVC